MLLRLRKSDQYDNILEGKNDFIGSESMIILAAKKKIIFSVSQAHLPLLFLLSSVGT